MILESRFFTLLKLAPPHPTPICRRRSRRGRIGRRPGGDGMSLKSLLAAAVLLSDARWMPPAGDVGRLPSAAECRVATSRLETRIDWLEAEMAVGPEWRALAMMPLWRDAQARRAAYDNARHAHECAATHPANTRYWLSLVRGILGEDDYLAGRWPDPSPVCRMWEAK